MVHSRVHNRQSLDIVELQDPVHFLTNCSSKVSFNIILSSSMTFIPTRFFYEICIFVCNFCFYTSNICPVQSVFNNNNNNNSREEYKL
jgi:hypothetical protein